MEEKKKYWESTLWKELNEKDPMQISRNCRIRYDDSGFFTVPSLGGEVRVYPRERRIEADDTSLSGDPDYQLLIVSHLLYGQNIAPSGEWVSEKDLKGGSTFFRGPHALPSVPLERKFGEEAALFEEKARLLGAEKADYGDAAMEFPVLPLISLIVVLWLKDDEFPARVTFLMDRTIEAQLPLDVISAMTASVTNRLLSL